MITVIHSFFRHLFRHPPVPLRIFILLAAILLYGTTGFLYFELTENPDLSWTDGLWYTVVTMTTVGYGDLFPKTPGGRFLVGWPVMLFGIGLLGYTLSVIAAALITSKNKELKGMSAFALENHLVLFNYGGLAKIERILEELRLDPAFANSTPVVLVDEHLDQLPPELQKRGLHYVRGNPARDETLTRASIDTASHTIILSRDPADPASDHLNVAIALAVEGRRRRVNTVVECVDQASEELLRKIGCDRIVCTSRFDAFFLSQELLNPGVQELVGELLSAHEGQQIYFTRVSREAMFAELAAKCRALHHLALGISTAGGIQLNVADQVTVHQGEALITIGAARIAEL